MPQFTRQTLEQKLGPAADFIIAAETRGLVAQWAIRCGYEPIKVHGMTAVDLANLYHAEGPGGNRPAPVKPAEPVPTDEQKAAAKALFDMLTTGTARPVEMLAPEAPAPAVVTAPDIKSVNFFDEHYKFEIVHKIVALNHPAMLVGPAGCGKTTIGKRVADALNLSFYITSTINDTHELVGFVDGHGVYHRTPFREAFEHGGVWIADEIDAWDAGALLAANSALANGFTVFPDSPLPVNRHANFRMIATANTFGSGADRVYVGRNELDAASLDRFAMIEIDYDLNLEDKFAAGNDEWLKYVWKIRKLVNARRIRHVVSSRAIIMGSAALAAGVSLVDVQEIYVFKGMSETDREKLQL